MRFLTGITNKQLLSYISRSEQCASVPLYQRLGKYPLVCRSALLNQSRVPDAFHVSCITKLLFYPPDAAKISSQAVLIKNGNIISCWSGQIAVSCCVMHREEGDRLHVFLVVLKNDVYQYCCRYRGGIYWRSEREFKKTSGF